METTETCNYLRQQYELEKTLEDARRAADQLERDRRATAAMKANMWLSVTRLQERLDALRPLVDAEAEAYYAELAAMSDNEREAQETESFIASLDQYTNIRDLVVLMSAIDEDVRDGRMLADDARIAATQAAIKRLTVTQDAAITEDGSAAVETAERILSAARTIQRRQVLAERFVRVWVYDDPDYPNVWDGELMTMAAASLAIAERSANQPPRITRTYEGYWSFCWRFGQRIVVKGATADELRDAYRAANAA